MKTSVAPYALPEKLEPNLARILAYWEDLKRGENRIPFWDDVKPTALSELEKDTALIEVFDGPLRFRFDIIGQAIVDRYGTNSTGSFLDEIGERSPIEQLDRQCRATVDRRAPTYFRCDTGITPGSAGAAPYSRIVLPLWGNGRIQMLLCGIA